MTAIAATEANASTLQLLGAWCFGAILGWFLYFTNRYRSTVQLADVATLIGALGGAAILALFPAKTDLFGAYGVGLFCGFFGYLLVLMGLVRFSPNFDRDWFLDGRRKGPAPDQTIPPGTAVTSHPMEAPKDVIRN